jgi:hypothetical protein
MLERMSAGQGPRPADAGAQVATRPVGVLFGLELTVNPFSSHPAICEIKEQAA